MATETTSVYGGLAEITFHSGSAHYYTVAVPSRAITGLYQPGVTTIIGMKDKSGALITWAVDSYHKKIDYLIGLIEPPISREVVLALTASAKNTWREIKDETAKIGSLVHARLERELYLRSGLAPSPKLLAEIATLEEMPGHMVVKADAATGAGKRYFDKHKIEIMQTESPRWSAKYGYIGTGDLIARVDGEPKVLDYKTGKRLYPQVRLQLAAYQMAYQEEFGTPLAGSVAVNVGRDGSLETEARNNDTLEKDFAAFLALLTIWRWDYETDSYKNPKGKPVPGVVGPLTKNIDYSRIHD